MTTPRLRAIRPVTNRVVNPLVRRVAGRLPGFAVVVHVGRRSGRRHCTPLNVFHAGDDRVFALTYGSDVHWVQNVIAAGGCEIVERGRTVRLRDPRLLVDPEARVVRAPVRWFLRLLRVEEFLFLRPAEADGWPRSVSG